MCVCACLCYSVNVKVDRLRSLKSDGRMCFVCHLDFKFNTVLLFDKIICTETGLKRTIK